jgi:hypothetical protein
VAQSTQPAHLNQARKKDRTEHGFLERQNRKAIWTAATCRSFPIFRGAGAFQAVPNARGKLARRGGGWG